MECYVAQINFVSNKNMEKKIRISMPKSFLIHMYIRKSVLCSIKRGLCIYVYIPSILYTVFISKRAK